jgi:hypothetical protein
VLASALVLASVALAADPPSVQVRVEVVAVSAKGQKVDPPSLQSMRDEFQKSSMTKGFTSFTRLSESALKLVQGKPESVALAGGKTATLRLDQVKENTALVTVDVPQLVNTTLTLGRSGAIYQHVGKYADGVLFLALTPKK